MAQKKTQRYEREHGRRRETRQTVTGIPSTEYNDPGVLEEAEPVNARPARVQAGITRAVEPGGSEEGRTEASGNPITRAARRVRGMFTRAKHRLTHDDVETPIGVVKEESSPKAARLARRESDIPLDELARTYTPTQTSLKASFRADGRDQQRDQEFANGVSDNKWNDEDRYTNRSGDPRIGTHGRTYEAAERLRSDEE